MAIMVELPEQVESEMKRVWGDAGLASKVAEALVIEAYRRGLISRGKVGELLGLSFADRERLLHERDVAYNYDAEELVADMRTMEGLRDPRP